MGSILSVSARRSVLLSVAALGCGKAQQFTPPPPEVAVMQVAPRRVDEVFEFVGNVEASRSVDVRAQVEGVIMARPYNEGQSVQPGAALFRLDPTQYDADYRRARAQLTDAEARRLNANQNLERLTPLVKDNAISRQEYDAGVAQLRSAEAAVENARAAVDWAKKNLDETYVRAEIAGRVGKALLEVGARVRGPEDVLTTIDVLDPIYVTFRPSAQQLLSWKRDPEANRKLVIGGPLQVEAILPDGSTAPTRGRLDFIDPVLDPSTGTQQFRAEFRNAGRFLLPGQFVRVRLLGLARDSAILVPQRAVLQAMGRQSVYVVTAGDTVRARDVQASTWSGTDWIIERGLAAGDRVIVDGVQKVGPGAVVKPVPAPEASVQAARRDTAR
ncbi:MAG: efflux RND transporter periplasmic adaptor subunit [Gemmatimonadales bacterium]